MGNANQPVLPTPPIGEGRNGKREPGTPDLFGLERQEPRILDRREAAALVEVLAALRFNPAVAWCERMNSGAARMGARFVRFGWKGCPDVLGQLKDGRLLGVEVKGPAGKLRREQTAFLERIRCAGGVAFVGRDRRDVLRELSLTKDNRT
jgi:hypothetical protein